MSKPIDELINEARVFYQSLVQVTEQLHGPTAISLGMRAVLEFLILNGAETVPNMARKRRVTRQRMQMLTNQLMAANLVETAVNPATKRSPLVVLTDQGKALIQSMRVKEASLMTSVKVSDKDLKIARNVLEAVRLGIEAAEVDQSPSSKSAPDTR